MSVVGLVDFEQVKQDQKLYAKQFSEGNIYLERLLNDLYDAGMTTRACCTGHLPEADGLIRRAYVSINIDDQSLPFINHLLNRINNQLFYKYKFVITNNPAAVTFTIYAPDLNLQAADELFIQTSNELKGYHKLPYTEENIVSTAALTFINQFKEGATSEDRASIEIERAADEYNLLLMGTFNRREVYADAFDVEYQPDNTEHLPKYATTLASSEAISQKINDFNHYLDKELQPVMSR